MLHLVYILTFTLLAFLAVGNLIRNLINLGVESHRVHGSHSGHSKFIPHPELLDESGSVLNEPYLVMRSITVEDARERLDAIYKASPGVTNDATDDA